MGRPVGDDVDELVRVLRMYDLVVGDSAFRLHLAVRPAEVEIATSPLSARESHGVSRSPGDVVAFEGAVADSNT